MLIVNLGDTSPMNFSGFPIEGLDFLSELGQQDKAWFSERQELYKQTVAKPAKEFVVDVGERIQTLISAGIQAQPKTNGSIAPINNDLRFSPEASPYKDHLLFRFWEGEQKKVAPTLMIRMSPDDGVGFATGMGFADVKAWREWIHSDETGEPFAACLQALVDETDADVVGQGLKRVPKPYVQDHPRAELLKHKAIQARWIPPLEASPPPDSVDFAAWCAQELARAATLHRMLGSI